MIKNGLRDSDPSRERKNVNKVTMASSADARGDKIPPFSVVSSTQIGLRFIVVPVHELNEIPRETNFKIIRFPQHSKRR